MSFTGGHSRGTGRHSFNMLAPDLVTRGRTIRSPDLPSRSPAPTTRTGARDYATPAARRAIPASVRRPSPATLNRSPSPC